MGQMKTWGSCKILQTDILEKKRRKVISQTIQLLLFTQTSLRLLNKTVYINNFRETNLNHIEVKMKGMCVQ